MTKFNFSQIRNISKFLRLFPKTRQKAEHIHSSSSTLCTAAEIEQITELSNDHMTPEIKLRLITPNCTLWSSRGDNSPFEDPFWAFYWPGGQVLTRFIFDNPDRFVGRKVLDVGSGCGASAIACKMVGAKTVTANDIDPIALVATRLNAKINGVTVETEFSNMIGLPCSDWTTVLLGDMFYDEGFADKLVPWLCNMRQSNETDIFIGDPGRLPLLNHPIRKHLTKVFVCGLPISCRLENNGLSEGYVWKLDKTS